VRVACKVDECELDPEDGRPDVPGVCATCPRCGDEALAYGTSERSVKAALASLREECSRGETNFYFAEETGGESRMPDPVVKPWWEKR
jgi:hypothetical protein